MHSDDPVRTSPTLIYILGFPFSGSTIFSMALGSSPHVFNGGEIAFVEHDFHAAKRCSCGCTLAQCPFWAPLACELREAEEPHLDLSETGTLHALESRALGLRRKAMLLAGMPLERVFPAAALQDYARRHENFLHRLARRAGVRYVLDASKSERRLACLLRYTRLDIRVIVLVRSSRWLFAARLKRARRRNAAYTPVLSPIYLLWLAYGLRRIARTLEEVPADRIAIVDSQRFAESPRASLEALSCFLGEDLACAMNGNVIPQAGAQHVFTGSSWLSKHFDASRPVVVKPPQPDGLSFLERRVFELGRRLFPRIAAWDRSIDAERGEARNEVAGPGMC